LYLARVSLDIKKGQKKLKISQIINLDIFFIF